MTPVSQILLFGTAIDNLTMGQAVERVRELLMNGHGRYYVTTPNVDHIIRLQRDPVFRRAYAGAALVLADGMPVVWASRPLGRPLRARVCGADLLPYVCELAASLERSVFLLGGRVGAAERAAENLRRRYPRLLIAGTCCPPMGFERDPSEERHVVERVNGARPDVLAIGLGSPKQELWIAARQTQLDFGVALCVGAAIDYAAQMVRRAPRWMQQSGFEWLWRLMQEPRRMWKRYLIDDMAFARLVAQEWWRARFKQSREPHC